MYQAPQGKVMMTTTESLIGDVVLGSFKLKHVLGQGSFATCYLAEQLGTDRVAVVKITHAHLIHGPFGEQIRMRFAAEVRAATRVSHPNLATIYITGETQNGLPIIAMEYVNGSRLDDFLDHEAPLNSARLSSVFRPVIEVLAELHDAGIIHRDVSPGNIMVTEERKPVLLDFGIAKLDFEYNKGLTMGPIGTPLYMAPEQGIGKATAKSDIFSLGAIIWWALTGRERQETPLRLAGQQAGKDPLDPRELNPNISPQLADLVQQLLDPNPAKRPSAKKLLAVWDSTLNPKSIATSSKAQTPEPSAILSMPKRRREGSPPPRRAVPGERAMFPKTPSGIKSRGFVQPDALGSFSERPKTGRRRRLGNHNTTVDNAVSFSDAIDVETGDWTRPKSGVHLQSPQDAKSTLQFMLLGRDMQLQRLAWLNLRELNCGITSFDNLEEALDEATQTRFSAVLLCPSSLQGDDIIEHVYAIKNLDRDYPIYVFGHDRGELHRAPGADAYFTLPADAPVMRMKLEALETMPSDSPINPAAIARLKASERLQTSIEFFIGIMPDWIVELRRAAENKNHYRIETLSGHIERAATMLGAHNVLRKALRLKKAAPLKNTMLLPLLVDELERSFQDAFQALSKLRQRL